MTTKVDDYNNLKEKVQVKEVLTDVESTTPIYEILENIEYGGDYYTYGYYTEEELGKYTLFDSSNCDNKFKDPLGEGTYRKCKTHNKGFKYNKIVSELLIKTKDEVITIKPNDWKNVNNHKTKLESLGWKCKMVDDNPDYLHLECNEEQDDLSVYIGYSGEVIGYEHSSYCYVNDDNASWCLSIE